MPIHLPPISRRKFLIRSIMAGASLACSPRIFAADKSTDENFWVLFSDTHIAADRAKIVRDVNMTDHFVTVSREITALPQRAAGVFVIGDCAWNSGEKEDYATFTNLIEPIRTAQMPVHLALGNHDNRERFWDALEEEKAAKRPLADRQVVLLQTPRVNWFILDSLDKTLVTTGLVGAEQLDWLAKTLDANSNKPAVILVHHNLDSGEKSIGLRDTEELFKVMRPRKQLKACVFGHTQLECRAGRERHSSGQSAAGGLCLQRRQAQRLGAGESGIGRNADGIALRGSITQGPRPNRESQVARIVSGRINHPVCFLPDFLAH
jgi:hypothetical protein